MMAQAIPVAISPILSRLFTPEDFGVLALYVAITGVLGAIANGRYELAIMLPQEDSEARVIVTLGILISCGVSLCLLVGVLLGGDWVAAKLGQGGSTWWLYVAPFSVLLIGVFNMLNYYNNRLKKYKTMSASHISKAGMMSAFQVGAGSVKVGAPGLVVGRIVGESVSVLVLLLGNKGAILSGVDRGMLIRTARRYQNFPK